ncbi:FkbM family methyltransferase [Methanobrevibacter sp.]|uniref:FkbM family methyltransferase n=1 Tax=Methanobrevibacter sp. TaxID=66852 RepID=UPI003869DB4F
MKKIKYVKDYFKYLKNPISALIFKFGFKKECEIKLKKSNEMVKLREIASLNRLMYLLTIAKSEKHAQLLEYIKELDTNEKIVIINDINYINVHNTDFKEKHPVNYEICIEEFFSDDEWDMLTLNNRDIIDIGANVGDTALHFAKNGANVIAFEPVKHLYELGLENISLNPDLKDKIKFINKAVGGKKGKLNIETVSTDAYINSTDHYEIDVITVQDILNDYAFPADVLKMDCEGCEFEIILNEDLTMFNEIIFEHHSKIAGKDYKPLIEKLKKEGFKINTYPVAASKQDFDDIGIIHAFK